MLAKTIWPSNLIRIVFRSALKHPTPLNTNTHETGTSTIKWFSLHQKRTSRQAKERIKKERIPSAFQRSSVLLSAVQPSAVKLFTRPQFGVIYHRHLGDFKSRSPPKIHHFSNLSLRQQKSEKSCSQSLQTTNENRF